MGLVGAGRWRSASRLNRGWARSSEPPSFAASAPYRNEALYRNRAVRGPLARRPSCGRGWPRGGSTPVHNTSPHPGPGGVAAYGLGHDRPSPKRQLYSQAHVQAYMRTDPFNWSHIAGQVGHYNVRRKHRLPSIRATQTLTDAKHSNSDSLGVTPGLSTLPTVPSTAAAVSIPSPSATVGTFCAVSNRKSTIQARLSWKRLPRFALRGRWNFIRLRKREFSSRQL